MILDLHVHTRYSGDSSIDPAVLYKVAKLRGLDGIAVTDHDTTRGWEHFPKIDDFEVILGMEKKTEYGSIIGLFMNEGLETTNFEEVIDEIKDQDGVVVIPHPFDSLRRDTLKVDSIDERVLRAKVDAIEVFNSRCILNRFNEKAEILARDLMKHKVGGSDAHTLGEVGNAHTTFECDSKDEIHGLLKKNGPIANVVQGRLSSRLVHVATFLHKLWN
ncbi:MAG: PHP domain-containing protein [Candidatus Bathyarchaeota archaeon]